MIYDKINLLFPARFNFNFKEVILNMKKTVLIILSLLNSKINAGLKVETQINALIERFRDDFPQRDAIYVF